MEVIGLAEVVRRFFVQPVVCLSQCKAQYKAVGAEVEYTIIIYYVCLRREVFIPDGRMSEQAVYLLSRRACQQTDAHGVATYVARRCRLPGKGQEQQGYESGNKNLAYFHGRKGRHFFRI